LESRAGNDHVEDRTSRATAADRLDREDLGIRAVHFRWFEPREAATFVRTAESYEGFVSRLFRRQLQRVLDNALESGLGSLKDEVERRTARRPTLSAEP
jgi:hypothetical protein